MLEHIPDSINVPVLNETFLFSTLHTEPASY